VITADEGIMGHAMTVVGYDEGRKALAACRT
jgi:C1A family cysteine protease